MEQYNQFNKRILVIDDNQDILETYQDILSPTLESIGPLSSREGTTDEPLRVSFDLVLASQGQEGFKYVKKAMEESKLFAVAFIDMRMPPGWDGLETAQKIRKLDNRIYIIIVTGYTDYAADELHDAVKHKLLFVRKPFTEKEIYQLARNFCQSWQRDYELWEYRNKLEKMVMDRTIKLEREIKIRKQAEEKIKAAQEYARNLIESSLDMVISVDKKRRIVEFNQAAEKTFGYSKVEVLGKHINILYANPAEGLKAHKTTRQAGQFYGEILNKRKNGETFTSFLSSSILMDENSEFLGVMGVSRDITDSIKTRKELEVALVKALDGERVKALFMANMSHEIRTPLNAILGFTDLLEISTSNLVSEEEKGFFDTIRNSGNRLMQTVHEILDISQIEAGTYNLKIEQFDLVGLVRDLVNGVKPMADTKGLKMKYTWEIDSAFIKADLNGVSQAISNILDNAVKYTEQGKIIVSIEQKSKQYVLSIHDTGIGIAEEYLENMFKVFTQESEGYTKKFQGIGLGMAIAKRHLDMNQVGIDVESTKNVGTTFTLTFKPVKKRILEKQVEKVAAKDKPIAEPVEKQVEKVAAKDKPIAEPVEKQQVLLVEDDPNSQRLIEYFLKGQYNICFAVSVDEAKQQLQQNQVDLILLDLSLVGNEDGLDLVRWMRKTKTWQKTPVIATTAHAFTKDRDNCIAAECNDYISKPIKREKLLEKIKQQLNLAY
ncbi:MAG: response regulator [Candidatus Marinimicrobia bacterium]|nr:response regulator [Candidatus Neomarinimicrobiota bacterium]